MMTRSLSLPLLLALGASAAGCAATPPDGDDDYGDGGGSGSNEEPIPLTAEGKYGLHSTYDIATNMPGKAGAAVNAVIDATDSADDPTHWILDQIVAKMPDGSLKNTVQGAIPYVAGYLNDRLLEIAPNFVVTIRDLGNKFGQAARNFGTMETLEIAAGGQATKVVTGVEFTIDQIELQYPFADYNMMDVTVPNVAVTLETTGRITIADHKVPLSYGKVLRIAMDEVVIPLIDPSAVKLEDLFKKLVNCKAVGQYMFDALDIGSASTFETACLAGLGFGSSAIYGLINQVDDNALEFGLNGVARGVDKNKDGKMDSIQTGAWMGTLAYGSNSSPLAAGATFRGERM